ncbi:MAG: hypothetical protein FE048_03905 [Thermoplasmata archaeon]|nr:MAG: hypothetical protein FE048_03905 [Thermoplasmata archaeon]
MTEERERKIDNFRVFGMVLSSLPSLMFRLGKTFLKFKREAKKGGHIFQKELIAQGLDTEKAAELTEIYLESSNLKQYIMLLWQKSYGE